MAYSKVVLNGTALIDLTDDTVIAGALLSGYKATKRDGVEISGSVATKTSADMTVSGSTVTAPAGYYATSQSKSVASGTVTPSFSPVYVSTYFTAGTSSDYSMTITPQYTNTAGYVAAHTSAQSGAISYYKIKGVTPVFDGGVLTASSTATGTNVTFSSTSNGIVVQTKYSATSTAVQYNGNGNRITGWLDIADNSQALAPQTIPLTNGTTYSITSVAVPKDKGFTLSTVADTALDSSSDVNISNAAYRQIKLSNVANGAVSVTGAGATTFTAGSATTGSLTVNAYNSSGAAENNKAIVTNGKWVATAVSAAGTFYGRVTVSAGSFTNNTSGGNAAGQINWGKQLKIGKGYYANDTYYIAQAAPSGSIQLTQASSTDITNYATATVRAASVGISGGGLSGTATASGTNCSISDSANNSGAYFTTACVPTRAKVVCSATTAGWVSGTVAELPLENAIAMTSKTYYVNSVTLTAGKEFVINTPVGNFKFICDASNNVTVTEV